MSQRLITKARVWGVTQSGLALVALRGSDPGDSDDNDQNLNDDNDSSGDEGSDEGKDDGASSDKKDDRDAEIEAIKARMRAADRRAAAAEAKAKEYEDKDKSEGQRLSEENESLKSEVETLKKSLQEQRLQNAFLTSNDYTWQDAEAALRLADLSGVVDEDGEVDKAALKKALKALAEGKPFLVKTQEGNGESKNGPSGSSTGSSKNNRQQSGPSEDELRRRYPALANRF